MKHFILNFIVVAILTIIFTASNSMMIFWNDNYQWLILVILSSISLGLIVDDTRSQIKILVVSWVVSLLLTTYIICYPLMFFGESVVKLNELFFATVSKLFFIILIGIILSSIISIFTSLIVERGGEEFKLQHLG